MRKVSSGDREAGCNDQRVNRSREKQGTIFYICAYFYGAGDQIMLSGLMQVRPLLYC